MNEFEFKQGFEKFVKIYPKRVDEEALLAYFDRFKWIDAE